ncbi:RimK family alpha-L-glutamate ligase [Psychrobacillus sp. FJAT-21963]|uniref:ATP-grasp domain-containing protein n=1 Tax=Psychrobacillus sp. FJAT-21963 TaxID=1712028 RepID=UPI0006F637E2|nr:RimK family alpha-L-glutamate ligase [Psychrobacillus sp. FJAT-21963]KQL34112.1 30S ribosomal protein S6 glutaminyl transferase [Psychrobacillus sp. FJAT-21963]
MQTCWIVYNGSLTDEKFIDQALLLQEAAIKQGIQATLVKNYELLMDVQLGLRDTRPDFVIFLDKDILLAKFLKNEGIPVFNDPDIIEICDNKARQYMLLAKAQVPMPRTIIAPKVYTDFTIQHTGFYEQVLETIKLPMIIKEAHGSFGFKVYLIETKEQFFEKVEELNGKEYVFQEFIENSRGRDIRVNVVGGQVIACMHRHSETDFRANITNGGTASQIELTERQKEVAIHAAQALNAEFAGVDLLFGEDEEPLVCEVNGVAHIRNIYNVTGINVGDAMISYALSKVGTVLI